MTKLTGTDGTEEFYLVHTRDMLADFDANIVGEYAAES